MEEVSSVNLEKRALIVLIVFACISIFILLWIMLFYENSFVYFSIRNNLALFFFSSLFLYLTDNLSIYYKGPLGNPKDKHFKIRVITNMIGYMPLLVLFGPKISIISILITRFLRFNEEKKDILLLRKSRGATYYFICYSISSVIYDRVAVKNLLWALLLFILVSKVLNILVLHIENSKYYSIQQRLYGVLNDLPLFLANIPALYLVSMAFDLPLYRNHLITLGYYFFSIELLLYWLFLKYRSNYAYSKLEHEKVLNIKEGLENVLKVFKMIKSTKPPKELLMDIAKIVAEYLGYRYVLISIFNNDKGVAERVAYYGFDDSEFERLENNPPQIDEVKNLLKPVFKISNSYFIPEGAIGKLDERKIFIGEYQASESEDSWKPLDILIVPFYDRNGMMIGYISPDGPLDNKRPTIEQIKMLEIFVEQIVSFLEDSKEFTDVLKKASTDSLTGLYNHSYFYNYLEQKISTSNEYNEFSIILLDLDNFKGVNDTFGHSFGDTILKKVAEIIKVSIRNTDVACRYGGDEFAIILPNMSKRAAKGVAERLLDKFRKTNFEKGITLTASIGVATFPEDGKNMVELFEKADYFLYVSKSLGKNTITG